MRTKKKGSKAQESNSSKPATDIASPQNAPQTDDWIRVVAYAVLAWLVVWGAWQRVESCDRWPSTYHIMRQYMSALRARDIYLAIMPSSQQSEKEQIYYQQVSREEVYEPPINESITALAYLVIGKESPSVSTYFSTLVWLAGGAVLFLIVRQLTKNPIAQMAAVGFYMNSPLGLIVSRTFQPEPLMIATFLLALWLVLRSGYPTTWRRVLWLGTACGMLLLAKPGFMLFPLCAAFTGLGLAEVGIKRLLSEPYWYAYGILCALPSLFWIQVVCPQQQGVSFLPALLWDMSLWGQWIQYLEDYYGWTTLLFVILGIVLASSDRWRWIYLGLLAGYMVFVIATNYRSMSHTYYCAVLIPLVSICLCPLIDGLFQLTKRKAHATIGIMLLAVWLTQIGFSAGPEIQSYYAPLSELEYAAIGHAVGVGGNVVAITEDYARGLKYHSYLDAKHWPHGGDIKLQRAAGEEIESYTTRLENFRTDGATHFIVILTERVHGEQEILQYLAEKYTISSTVNGKYVIFDLNKPKADQE
ncbi:glycosyltransferase family 39 protein [Blastopirellula sp. J2-11]|uniref:ArnT family glycosyltransferase n=1 Tax=Blastopirellula sp. J2-11 TaxID=2943192 RepID=UPI0021C8D11B|nr:glycosyltransferase family 39 protein [Blastopirellula sp. J2-11]UUO07185.1 glycosyltransferase family 39 protein [Blastopirellula sp. J2-11]